MVREYGPFRERFEEHILERTANPPSLVPLIMYGQGKACFRLACKDTLNHSYFTSWSDEASLRGGPGMLQLDHAIVACLRELDGGR